MPELGILRKDTFKGSCRLVWASCLERFKVRWWDAFLGLVGLSGRDSLPEAATSALQEILQSVSLAYLSPGWKKTIETLFWGWY